MNDSFELLRQVSEEMRGRRVNHGRSPSPTLIEWADRIDQAIASLSAKGEVAAACEAGQGVDYEVCVHCGATGLGPMVCCDKYWHDPRRIKQSEYLATHTQEGKGNGAR